MATWVHLTLDNRIDSHETGQPFNLVRRSDGCKVLWWEGITEKELNACGWFRVAAVPRPADTDTHTCDRSVIVTLSGPTEQWVVREKTEIEVNDQRRGANDSTLRQQAVTAMDNNRTYLQIASPTNAQVVAQVRALTQQMNGVARLVLGRLDGIN